MNKILWLNLYGNIITGIGCLVIEMQSFDWCPQIKSTCFLNKFIEAIQENQHEGTDFGRANYSNNEAFGPIR